MPLNLNLATKEELDLLPGIDGKLAERIIRYRTEVGPFRTVRELAAVDGVTQDLVLALSALVTIGEAETPPSPLEFWQLQVLAGGEASGDKSVGHRVGARFERQMVEGLPQGSQPSWVYDQVFSIFDAAGQAMLRFPDRKLLRGDIDFEVYAPDGRRLQITSSSRFFTKWPQRHWMHPIFPFRSGKPFTKAKMFAFV